MKFPENKINVQKVTDLIKASLARAPAQKQKPTVEVISQVTPFELDPWQLSSSRFVGFELPDGYIVPKMIFGSVYYEPNPDRISLSREGYKEMVRSLESLGVKFREAESDANHQVFWENLYTWGGEVIWVDKAAPEDIVCKVLFNKLIPTYANRFVGTAIADVGKILRGMVFYDKDVLVSKFPDYALLSTTTFMVDGKKLSVFRPGNGYANGTTVANLNRLASADSVGRSIVGYLNAQLTETERATYLRQSWFARISALTQSSVFGNMYWSYCLRGLVK